MNKTEFCGVSINRRFLHHSRSHPEVPSIPSLTMIGTMTKAARGSAHHPPTSAFNKRPLAKGLVYRRPHYQEYCGADTQSGKLLGLTSAGRENAPTLWQAAVSNFPLLLASTKRNMQRLKRNRKRWMAKYCRSSLNGRFVWRARLSSR